MLVNFIENGFMITSEEMDFPPDNEDRVIIFDNLYVVNDRIFNIGKNKYLDVHIHCLSRGINKL